MSRWVEKPPDDVEGWRRVWGERLEYRPRAIPALFSRIGRLFEGLFHPHFLRQRDYNIVLADLIHDLQTDLRELRRDYHHDLEETRSEIGRARELVPIGARRNDALVSAIDRKIESLASRVRDLTLPRLEHEPVTFRDDFVYRRLEDALRGGSSDVAASLNLYVDLAATHAPVIDLGCGRGEFLGLCRARDIAARGFDSNERSVAELRERGLNVGLGAIPDCLNDLADGSVGSILAVHVVEHLPFSALVGLFSSARRVLRPGGLLMLETPNAEALQMSAVDFWRDPTHLGPRHSAALVTIAREFAFSVEEISPIHPYPEANRLSIDSSQPEDLQRLVERLNTLIYGSQDLRAIFRRTA